MTTLRCVSIISLWDETDIGRCSIFAFPLSMGSSISHIFIDVLLLSFPISLIWRLHTYRSHRIILTGLFASGIWYVEFLSISPPRSMPKKEFEVGPLADECPGSSVIIVSIIRFIYWIRYFSSHNIHSYNADVFIWASVEVNFPLSMVRECQVSLLGLTVDKG